MKKKNKNNRNADAQSAAKCLLESKKVLLAKIIQNNERTNEMFNVVLDNYDEKERLKAADHMLTLIAGEEKGIEDELLLAYGNALQFYMLVFVCRIREILGLTADEVHLGICPF